MYISSYVHFLDKHALFYSKKSENSAKYSKKRTRLPDPIDWVCLETTLARYTSELYGIRVVFMSYTTKLQNTATLMAIEIFHKVTTAIS